MKIENEVTIALTTLRFGINHFTGCIAVWVMPAARTTADDLIIVEAKSYDGFANDQALIELFGKLGVV